MNTEVSKKSAGAHFPMIERETFFTNRDLEELTKKEIPYPQGLKSIDEIFKEFVEIMDADFNTLRALINSSANQFFPRPLLVVNSANDYNHGCYIPGKYHSDLIGVWLRQHCDFIKKIGG
ncbi:MAG: hypothetical protein M3Q24_00175 [bacterium]|nr:hypothetical protein [bacterium]